MSRSLSFFVICSLLFLPSAARAQVNMPDPSAIAGTPLPAPELAAGIVTVRVVRERMGNNIAGQEVTLTAGQGKRTLKTDAQGRAQFDGLAPGMMVQATTTVDGETLTSQQFAVPNSGGVRVALIAGIAAAAAKEKSEAEAAAKMPARPGVVEIGPESRIIIEYQDDNLTVFYLLEILNNARTPIDIGGPLLIRLPTGAAGASMMQGSSPNAGAQGDMVTITGPFPPGKTVAQVSSRCRRVAQATRCGKPGRRRSRRCRRHGEDHRNMQIASPQHRRERDELGWPAIRGGGGRVNAGDTLVLHLTGLPAHSNTPRNATLLAAVVTFALGAWFAFSPAKARAAQDTKLHARREKLMNEVVALERKRRTRPLSEADEARLQRVTAELERVIAELDRGAAA